MCFYLGSVFIVTGKVYFMAHPSDGTLSIHFPYTTHAEKGGVKRPNLAVLTER